MINPISNDVLDSDQDPGPSPSEKHDFTLNESYWSEIDSFSFMSKEDSSLDEDKEETYEPSITTSISTLSASREEILDSHGETRSN